MSQGVVFRHTVEAFVERLINRHKLFTSRELQERGFSPPRDTDLDAWVVLLRESARRLSPTLDEDAALERVGREVFQAYGEGLVGRGLFIVLRLLGPRRALLRMADSMATADNFTQVKPQDLGPRQVRLHFNHSYGVTAYQRGLLSELMALVGAKDHRVDLAHGEGDEVSYTVTW